MKEFDHAIWQDAAFALPPQVVYWAAIRLFAGVTSGQWDDTVVPELTAMEALKRYHELHPKMEFG